jgi:hypothetical protein
MPPEIYEPVSTIRLPAKPAFHSVQRGKVGDLTASRKVRVFIVPDEEAFEMLERGEKPPERLANALYLEWFSESNGRVVIESADYELEISEPKWRMSPDEEEQRRQQSKRAGAISCSAWTKRWKRKRAASKTRRRNGTSMITNASCERVTHALTN